MVWGWPRERNSMFVFWDSLKIEFKSDQAFNAWQKSKTQNWGFIGLKTTPCFRVNGIATVCGSSDQSFGFGCFMFGCWVPMPISFRLVWLMWFNRTGEDIWWVVHLSRYVRFLHFADFHRFYTAWCGFWYHRIRSKFIICFSEKLANFSSDTMVFLNNQKISEVRRDMNSKQSNWFVSLVHFLSTCR